MLKLGVQLGTERSSNRWETILYREMHLKSEIVESIRFSTIVLFLGNAAVPEAWTTGFRKLQLGPTKDIGVFLTPDARSAAKTLWKLGKISKQTNKRIVYGDRMHDSPGQRHGRRPVEPKVLRASRPQESSAARRRVRQ